MSTGESLSYPLPWQEGLWSDWRRHLESGRLPHALLISGLAGLGKRQLANAFAQSALCSGDIAERPCGRCKSCGLIQAGSHPDLRSLEPEEAGKAIKIGQIRELMEFLAGTSQQGGWKCVIIDPADAMNTHAANALLKSLEEPPGETLIILVSATPGRLMATLRSRCRQAQVRQPSREDALTWLKPRLGDRAAAFLDYAHGAPCAALAASREDKLANREAILEALLNLAQAQSSALETAKLMQGQPALEAIDQVLAFLNQAAKARLGSPEASADQWQAVIQRLNHRLLFRYRDKLIQAKGLLLSGANPNQQLLWEELMFDWQALTAIPGKSRAAGRPRP